MFVFDTDAITHHQNAHKVLSARVASTPREQLFTSSVTVQEQLRGRLAELSRYHGDTLRFTRAHHNLVQTVRYFNSWNILPYDQEADAVFRQLLMQRIRVGSQDLRIAAIALRHGFTVVTSNLSDFALVPGLSIADWTIPRRDETS